MAINSYGNKMRDLQGVFVNKMIAAGVTTIMSALWLKQYTTRSSV